jgi:cobalt-zinc-cadmium efflux system outer membrane protein
MRGCLGWALVLVFSLVVAGCAGYQAKPVVGREVLRDLQQIRLDALRPAAPPPPGDVSESPAFDASDGLSAHEAVAVALFLNPDLRAFRKERGVAEGELIAAGLLPNPHLQVTWLFIQKFTKSLGTSGWDVGLTWSPPRPGERGAKLARAQAQPVDRVARRTAHEE